MKQLLTVLSLALGIAAAADTVIFKDDFESTANWFKNPACETPQFGGGGTLQLVDGGKTGKCLKIVTNSKQMFMLNLRRSLPVKDGSRLRISFLVRGKGAISINPLGRTADKKTVYLHANTGIEKISNSDWEKIPFIVIFKDPKGTALTEIGLRLNVLGNSEVLIDDCLIEVTSKP